MDQINSLSAKSIRTPDYRERRKSPIGKYLNHIKSSKKRRTQSISKKTSLRQMKLKTRSHSQHTNFQHFRPKTSQISRYLKRTISGLKRNKKRTKSFSKRRRKSNSLFKHTKNVSSTNRISKRKLNKFECKTPVKKRQKTLS